MIQSLTAFRNPLKSPHLHLGADEECLGLTVHLDGKVLLEDGGCDERVGLHVPIQLAEPETVLCGEPKVAFLRVEVDAVRVLSQVPTLLVQLQLVLGCPEVLGKLVVL